jgi:hypothetical protein
MPSSRNDWPDGVLDACAAFKAGDVVEDPPLFYFADPARPVWARTHAYSEGSEGPEIVDAGTYAPPFGIITSQTCDVGEVDFEAPMKPWIMVSPAYDLSSLEGNVRSLLKKGLGPLHWLHLPALTDLSNGFWVADLRIEVPVEKGWFVGRSPISGFTSEAEQRRVVERVAAIRTRPAWSELVVEKVQRRLFFELKNLRDADRTLFDEVLKSFEEIGCRTDSMLEPRSLLLAAFARGGVSREVDEWWARQVDAMRADLAPQGVEVHEAMVHDLDSLPVTEYRQYAPVPIQRFSPF